MFKVLAIIVKLTKVSMEDNTVSAAAENTNFILGELKLAQEHLVFKRTSVNPGVKCSEIVASINVKKMNPQLVASIHDWLCDTLPIYGLHLRFVTADAAGSTWKVFDSMAAHPVSKVIPSELRCKYELIDYSIKIMLQEIGDEVLLEVVPCSCENQS